MRHGSGGEKERERPELCLRCSQRKGRVRTLEKPQARRRLRGRNQPPRHPDLGLQIHGTPVPAARAPGRGSHCHGRPGPPGPTGRRPLAVLTPGCGPKPGTRVLPVPLREHGPLAGPQGGQVTALSSGSAHPHPQPGPGQRASWLSRCSPRPWLPRPTSLTRPRPAWFWLEPRASRGQANPLPAPLAAMGGPADPVK